MNSAWLDQLAAQQHRRLEQHYGHNQIRHFQARGLATISLVLGLILIVFTLAFALMSSSLIATETKLVFLPLVVLMSTAFVASYGALLMGRETLARCVIAITVVGGVMLAVVLTGGFPTSIAAPILLLPAITFFCLYGARAGLFMAVLMPVLTLALYLAEAVFHVPLPNYTSTANSAVNLAFVMAASHLVAVMAIASYEKNNRLLSQRLDEELAKHAELANRDPLTGMGNARFFDMELKRLLSSPRASHEGLAVIYCDLDNFKPINDRYGHSVGDQVLSAVGKRLQAVTKQGVDVAARIGGDEFAIILVNCANPDVPVVCARIRASVTAPIMVNGTTFQVGISVGHHFASSSESDASEVIKNADVAMYLDKELKHLRQGAPAIAPTIAPDIAPTFAPTIAPTVAMV